MAGWGVPGWAQRRAAMGLAGPMKPLKVGARYFCGDSVDCRRGLVDGKPVAQGNKFTSSKAEYQAAVEAHYTDNHPDLHYPIDQDGIDAMYAARRKAESVLRMNADLKDLKKWNGGVGGGGGTDFSGFYRPVTRPRELADFTEFDLPDANLADAATEEIELDQLISIAARQGRRLLGVEIQNLDGEERLEFLTAADNADLDIDIILSLNTRTGVQNLDDPENLWRAQWFNEIANIEATAGTGTAIHDVFHGSNDVPPGGVVYVSPRLFFQTINNMDRQIDTGDLFVRIATISQPLSTFLLFELLEQFSGLFGFAA